MGSQNSYFKKKCGDGWWWMGMGSFVLLTLRWFYRFTCVAVPMQRSPGDDGLHVWSRSCFSSSLGWSLLIPFFGCLKIPIRPRPPGAGYHLASHEISSPLALTLLWLAHSCRTGCVKWPGESEGPSVLHHSDLEPEIQVPHTFLWADFGQRLRVKMFWAQTKHPSLTFTIFFVVVLKG